MGRTSYSKQKIKLHKLNPNCAYCGIETILPEDVPNADFHKGIMRIKIVPPNMATIEHIYSKLDPRRKEPNLTNEARWILVCTLCNGYKAQLEQDRLSREELWKRSGRKERSMQNISLLSGILLSLHEMPDFCDYVGAVMDDYQSYECPIPRGNLTWGLCGCVAHYIKMVFPELGIEILTAYNKYNKETWHKFIKFEGKFYDGESPFGVDSPFRLKFFKGEDPNDYKITKKENKIDDTNYKVIINTSYEGSLDDVHNVS